MKIFRKLSALCLVLLATFTLSFATPAISFAKAAGKAPVTVRTAAKKTTAKARLTKAKKAKAKARMTTAKRTAKRTAKARMTTAKRTAKRTTAKARLTAARRTTRAKARLTTAKFRMTAATAPKALKAGSRAKVTAKALNVRTGPAKTYRKVGTLKKGTSVKVVSSKAGWNKVQYGTRTGYVSSKYLK